MNNEHVMINGQRVLRRDAGYIAGILRQRAQTSQHSGPTQADHLAYLEARSGAVRKLTGRSDLHDYKK